MMGMEEALVGASDVIGVRNMKRDLDEYVAGLPLSAAGHRKFTHEQAIGHQKLMAEYARATTLTLIDCESNIVSFHQRPGTTKCAPLAALRCDGGDLAV